MNFSVPFDEVSKNKIIENILAEVEKNNVARVGYYAEQVLGRKKPIPYSIKSKIEATIVSSRKYISRPHPNFRNDFEILKNPNHIEEDLPSDLRPAMNPINQPNPTAKSDTIMNRIAALWDIISKHPFWSALITGIILLALSHFIFGSP